MEMKVSNMHFQKGKDRGIEFVIWWNLRHKSMDHDNICNMDQTVFFVFIYGNLVIGLFFPLILFLMWRKEQKDEKYRGYLLVLLIAFCIQGCSKQQDVEDHRFVLAMGFERLNEKKVLVRYSYADFDKAQSDSGTKIPSRSVTFLATSLKDANKKWKSI